MKYTVDRKAGAPAYMQLYAQLRSDLTSGFYEYGARLPSKRLLAEETGTSVVTVEHAYAILCDEGYAEASPRSGYYAIYRASDFGGGRSAPPKTASGRYAREYWKYLLEDGDDGYGEDEAFSGGDEDGVRTGAEGEAGSEYADGGSAGRDGAEYDAYASELFPYSVMAKAARRVLSEYGERLLIRSPGRGVPELRAALAAYLGRSCGIDASPAQIVVGSGAEYLYSLTVQLLGRERTYALEDPSYDKIRRVYLANGARIELLPLASDGIASDALSATGAGVLHVTPFNSFPAGVTATASKRREYLDWARERGGYIIEDNYESELTVSRKNEDTLFSLSGGEGVIYLNTFSRTVAPSLRVGYMVLPRGLLPAFEERLGFYTCTVPPLEQYLLARLIEGGDFERHINRVRRKRRAT